MLQRPAFFRIRLTVSLVQTLPAAAFILACIWRAGAKQAVLRRVPRHVPRPHHRNYRKPWEQRTVFSPNKNGTGDGSLSQAKWIVAKIRCENGTENRPLSHFVSIMLQDLLRLPHRALSRCSVLRACRRSRPSRCWRRKVSHRPLRRRQLRLLHTGR